MINQHAVEAALALLRPGLASDGFDLRQGAESTDSSVQVILEAKAGACLDCLVPEHMMIAMIEGAIRKEDSSLSRVELVKHGFEGLEAH